MRKGKLVGTDIIRKFDKMSFFVGDKKAEILRPFLKSEELQQYTVIINFTRKRYKEYE